MMAEEKAPSPETQAQRLARLKKEHKEKTSAEEAQGILTGDMAQARLARQREIESLDRETAGK